MLDLDDAHNTPVQWSSAMLTTVFAMWNCYITLLIFYAPSKKYTVDNASVEIEFSRLTDHMACDTCTRTTNQVRVVLNKTDAQLLQEFRSSKQRF